MSIQITYAQDANSIDWIRSCADFYSFERSTVSKLLRDPINGNSVERARGNLDTETLLGPEPGVQLSYIKSSGQPLGDAGDPYKGYDRFGRTVDMRWVTEPPPSPAQG